MVRPPCFDSNGMKKGAWSEDEDDKLRGFVLTYGHWNWRLLPKYAGLKRCGKSCRLRWMNHLKPGVKRGSFSKEEEDLVIKLHNQIGNKWSAIAAELPGRTDNDIKNFWHTRMSRRRRRQKPTPAAPTEAMMDPNQTQYSFESTSSSLIKLHEQCSPPPSFDDDSLVITQPQMDLWGDEFANFPPLLEEEFCYPEMNNLQDWIAYDEEREGEGEGEGEGGGFDSLFCLWS